jgi:hypothetical protein
MMKRMRMRKKMRMRRKKSLSPPRCPSTCTVVAVEV